MKGKLAIAVGAALALTAAVVAAQAPGYGPGWGMGGMGMGMGRGMGPGMMGGGPGMMYGGGPGYGYGFENGLAAQKSALKITSAQENAWNAYAETVKKQGDAMLARREAMFRTAPATALERADLQSKFTKEHSEQLEARNAAFKQLYDVLTPEQRTLVDQGPVASGRGFRGPGWR